MKLFCEGVVGDAAREEIKKAIQMAEEKTSAELVPMVVWSTVDPEVARLRFLLLWTVLCQFSSILLNEVFSDSIQFNYLYVVGFWFLGFLFHLGCYDSSWFLRLFSSKREMNQAAMEKAEIEFYRLGIGGTKSKTGVLFFVSMVEHQVVVLADKKIADKLPSGTWNSAVQVMVAQIARKDLTKGFVDAISAMAETLSPVFPKSTDDQNELSDRIEIRGRPDKKNGDQN
jgi:putative membrane protein